MLRMNQVGRRRVHIEMSIAAGLSVSARDSSATTSPSGRKKPKKL